LEIIAAFEHEPVLYLQQLTRTHQHSLRGMGMSFKVKVSASGCVCLINEASCYGLWLEVCLADQQ